MLVLHSAQALEITNLHKLRSLDYILHKPLCLSLCIHLEVLNPLGLLLRQNPGNSECRIINYCYWGASLSKQVIMHCILCLCAIHSCTGTCATKSLTKKIKPNWCLMLLNIFLPCTGNAPHWYIKRSNTRLHWSRRDSSYSCLSFIKTILWY